MATVINTTGLDTNETNINPNQNRIGSNARIAAMGLFFAAFVGIVSTLESNDRIKHFLDNALPFKPSKTVIRWALGGLMAGTLAVAGSGKVDKTEPQ